MHFWSLPDMRIFHRIRKNFRNLFGRDQIEESLDSELQAYVEDLSEKNVAKGMTREEARRHVLLEVGGIEQVKENVRETWLGNGIETTIQDVRYAFRSLLKSPGFTIVVVTTLALGIAVNLAMFSLINAVLWRPLPYLEPNKIVMIQVDARNITNIGATLGELRDLREHSHSLEKVSTISSTDANLEYSGEMEHLRAAEISDDFFPLLGVSPTMGRLFDSRIDAPHHQSAAILISDELWRRRFSADSNVIGQSVQINNHDMQIVGVMPRGFRLFLPPAMNASEQIDVWLPYRIDAVTLPYRGNPVAARLRDGITLDQANAELKTLVAQFKEEYPIAYAGGSGQFTARSLHDEMTREVRTGLFLLSGVVGFVLLIACVNVANLMLARGTAQQREFEIRRALGAGSSRIIRQIFIESLVLSVASGAIGLFCAHFMLEAIGRLGLVHIPLQSRAGVDTTITLFALGLSVITSFLFGLLPAWRMGMNKAENPLRRGRAETVGTSARKIQRTLVVLEVALSIVPLVCGGLMLRSFLNLLQEPLGFNPANVVTAKIPVDIQRYSLIEQRWPILQKVLSEVHALPGVQAVSAAWPLPLANDQQTRRVGSVQQLDVPPILATQQFAAPGYLSAVGTPLQQGRDFSVEDISMQRPVTIIDQALAKRLWPDGAIGKHLAVHRTGVRDDLEVIGVMSSTRVMRVQDQNIPHFMIPYGTYPAYMSLVVKTTETVDRLAPGIKAAVKSSQGGRAAFDIQPMGNYLLDSIGDTRFIMFVLVAFASVSLLLATVGLYGTLAYLTALRKQEFGIRLALGSSVRSIVAIVIRESFFLVAIGIGLGLIGVVAVHGVMQELVYGVNSLDVLTLVGVVVAVIIVSLAAAGVPAWHAARIDPQVSLRSN